MDVESLPIIGRAYQLGANPVTTTLVLLGPVMLGVIAVSGRSPVTIVLGIGYMISLPVSVAYSWWTGSREEDTNDEETKRNGE